MSKTIRFGRRSRRTHAGTTIARDVHVVCRKLVGIWCGSNFRSRCALESAWRAALATWKLVGCDSLVASRSDATLIRSRRRWSMESSQGNVTQTYKCERCQELRDLSLHLHELSLYCDLLSNVRELVKRERGEITPTDEFSSTSNISKWLRLAGQLHKVAIDAYQYQEAHLYCEPVDEFLSSESRHHADWLTPLTRFLFVSNALEECYRFMSPRYEVVYEESKSDSRPEYRRNSSAKAVYLLDKATTIALPAHYEHLIENYRKLVLYYAKSFSIRCDVAVEAESRLGYGLDLVRTVRNNIAHGGFPVVNNPEYSSSKSNIKRNLVNLLGQSSRMASLNIQMLLAIEPLAFDSMMAMQYGSDDDDETGTRFRAHCNQNYLLNLHLIQDFGLNESDYFRLLRAENDQ